MLQFDEYKVKLNNLAPALEELGQALDLESAERELDMLQAESAADGFWDNLAKAQKAADAKPEDEKLAAAAERAKKAAEDAAAGTLIPETFKDYLDKWVYSVADQPALLDKIGGSRLMRLKVEPHLGYSTTH